MELNGKSVEIDALGKSLENLAKHKGIVYYGREDAKGEPHPNGLKVMEMVTRNGLPVRLSTKQDFSDHVGPDGRSKD